MFRFTAYSPSLRDAGARNPAGLELETEAMEELCLLSCSPWFTLSLFSYTTQDHLHRGGNIHSRLGSLT